MKPYYSIFFLSIAPFFLLAQAPQAISYQGIARDVNGIALSDSSINLQFVISTDAGGTSVVYEENHSNVPTNNFGLFDLQIGTGTSSDDFSGINWASGDHFLTISIDMGSGFNSLGTTQLISVPYALYSQAAGSANTANSATLADQANTALDDGDKDASNEIQSITKSGNEIILSDGGTVIDEVDDADADPGNEIQGLSLNGSELSIVTDGGDASIELPSGGGLVNYSRLGNLNSSSVTVGQDWTALGISSTNSRTFTKQEDDTTLEITFNSRLSAGNFNGSIVGVRFDITVNNEFPDFGTQGSIRSPNSQQFQSLFAVFEDLPAGTYQLRIVAQAPTGSGTASNVLVDPGGWGGAIIVKELR